MTPACMHVLTPQFPPRISARESNYGARLSRSVLVPAESKSWKCGAGTILSLIRSGLSAQSESTDTACLCLRVLQCTHTKEDSYKLTHLAECHTHKVSFVWHPSPFCFWIENCLPFHGVVTFGAGKGGICEPFFLLANSPASLIPSSPNVSDSLASSPLNL